MFRDGAIALFAYQIGYLNTERCIIEQQTRSVRRSFMIDL